MEISLLGLNGVSAVQAVGEDRKREHGHATILHRANVGKLVQVINKKLSAVTLSLVLVRVSISIKTLI